MPSLSRNLEQVRAVNANLSITEQQRRLARAYAAADRKAEDATQRATQRAHLAYLRTERNQLRDLLKGLDDSEADVRADSFYASDAGRLQGALEELDYQRETLANRLARVESDLRRGGR